MSLIRPRQILPWLALGLVGAASPTPITPDYEGNCQSPQWSKDGKSLAFEVNYHDRKSVELYVMDAGQAPRRVEPMSRGATDLTAGFTIATETVVHEITFSPPDLGTFLYSASGAERDYDLFLDGGTRIARHPGTDGGGAWSPDGRHIVFTSARTGQGDLYLLEAAHLDLAPKRLTADPEASELYAAWAPDSRMVAFVGHTRIGDNLYLIRNVAYPEPAPITNWNHTQTRPVFSPDGTHIAFYSNHEKIDRFDLYVMTPDGTPRRLHVGVVMNAHGPVWLPDSSGLVAVVDDAEKFDPLFRVPLQGAATLLETGTLGNGDHALARLSDGKLYLALAAQGTPASPVRDFKRLYVVQIQ
jgi:Tol biopolymer transport system component